MGALWLGRVYMSWSTYSRRLKQSQEPICLSGFIVGVLVVRHLAPTRTFLQVEPVVGCLAATQQPWNSACLGLPGRGIVAVPAPPGAGALAVTYDPMDAACTHLAATSSGGVHDSLVVAQPPRTFTAPMTLLQSADVTGDAHRPAVGCASLGVGGELMAVSTVFLVVGSLVTSVVMILMITFLGLCAQGFASGGGREG